MTTANDHEIRPLDALDHWKLSDADQDLRGTLLIDRHGARVGVVTDMLADVAQERIVALRLEDERIVNVDAVVIRDGVPVLTTDLHTLPPAPTEWAPVTRR
ncbi:hypothetical protein [Sphingomonas dokdonensis]|uniref:PRC-barrel domain protein n=1 Tax=Sphingomonas dokdonensis TaxID=344880 RepID=A0A245ZEF2_9SPHN|nr:hypothetical protein [Sphingomonas dokdonensis]OWK28126.1 hypothetical protein SPDO_29590 [Sphingomonas dokdonensis]